MLIKILEHRIHKTEPSLLIDNEILVNAPRFQKKISANKLLLTHSHKENLLGLTNIKFNNSLIDIYVSREHKHFLDFHRPKDFLDYRENIITSRRKFKLNDIEVTPVTVQHEKQKTYGKACMAFLLNNRVMICTPCNKISRGSLEFFKNLDILIIDGGYRSRQLYNDHNSITEILRDFKDFNIKKIYFLGTHNNYKIKGKVKDSDIEVDTLVTGDIIKVK